MAHKPASCFLPDELEEIEIEGWDMKCLPGKAAVLMAWPREKMLGFELPDTVGGRLTPDFGRVIDIGPRRRKGELELMDVERGDYVLVRPYAGTIVYGWHPERELRLMGLERPLEGGMRLVPWDDSILMKLVDDWFKPVGGNIVIRRDRFKHDLLPDEVRPYKDSGVVMDAGIQVSREIIEKRVYLETEGPEDMVHLEFTDEEDLFVAHQSWIWSMEDA